LLVRASCYPIPEHHYCEVWPHDEATYNADDVSSM
jgi:hypothetical protein